MATLKAIVSMIDAELDDADRAHLRRWLDRDDAQETWDRLRPPSYPADNEKSIAADRAFIRMLLSHRKGIEGEEQLKLTNREWRSSQKKLREATARSLRRVADDVEGGSPALLRRAEQSVAADLNSIRQLLRYLQPQSVGEYGLARHRYARQVGKIVRLLLGRCADDLVAVLTEVALPGGEMTEGMVRGARREKDRKRKR